MAEPRGETWAIIPARGGSKGIPGKNLRPVAGAPLVAHAIRAARGAPSVDRVIVSTDADAIAAAARAAGAEVVRRPADISGDTASSESALLHALEFLAATEGRRVPGKETPVFRPDGPVRHAGGTDAGRR